ncbi:MAG TPA: hypothetical protein VFA15_02285 [Nitrososphaera sp.]|nr:hypothetical protein [Nitrososphaera sp.]
MGTRNSKVRANQHRLSKSAPRNSLTQEDIETLADEVRKDTLEFGFDERWANKVADLYKKAASA